MRTALVAHPLSQEDCNLLFSSIPRQIIAEAPANEVARQLVLQHLNSRECRRRTNQDESPYRDGQFHFGLLYRVLPSSSVSPKDFWRCRCVQIDDSINESISLGA